MSDNTTTTDVRSETGNSQSRSPECSKDINLDPNSHQQALRKNLYDVLADAVREQQEPSPEASALRVLDVGCGRGELLRILSSEGHHVLGIDADSACVTASSRFATCVQGTIGEAPSLFAGVPFDRVVVSHVLEHLANPYGALTALRGMGASRYVFAVPNVHRPIRLLRVMAGSSRCDHPRHIHGWGRPEFRALLTSVGFKNFQWYTDRVTVNPFSGGLGAIVNRLVSPVEVRILPRFFPALSSSLVVSCCSEAGRPSGGEANCQYKESEGRC